MKPWEKINKRCFENRKMENVTSNSLSKIHERQSPMKLIKIMSKHSILPSKFTESSDISNFENHFKTKELQAKSEWLGE